MERSLTQAVTQSWRFLSALAHSHSTHSVILWTTWSSTKPNMSAMHPMSWGQPSLTRPHSPLMVRTRWRLINPKATDRLLRQSHYILTVNLNIQIPSCSVSILLICYFWLLPWETNHTIWNSIKLITAPLICFQTNYITLEELHVLLDVSFSVRAHVNAFKVQIRSEPCCCWFLSAMTERFTKLWAEPAYKPFPCPAL